MGLLQVAQGFVFKGHQLITLEWITAVICFNGLHVAFTYVNMLVIPEYRKVIFDHYKLNYKKQILIFGLILGVFFIAHDRGFFKDSLPLRLVAMGLLVYLPTWHSKRQSAGLSLLMNTRYQKLLASQNLPFLGDDAKSRKIEHFAVHLFIVATCIYLIRTYLPELGWKNYPKDELGWASALLYTLALGLFIYGVSLLKHKMLIRHKLFFSIRYLIGGLFPFTPMAGYAVKAIHGLEYLDLQARTFTQSRVQKKFFSIYLGLCFIFCFAKFFMDWPTKSLGVQYNDPNMITKFLGVVGTTATYFHYYMDSLIYKMSDPVVRQEIFPLISMEQNNPSPDLENQSAKAA